MQFHIITIFPEIFKSYFNESIIRKSQDRGLFKINIHNLRDFTDDKRKVVDDRPFGGGPGMVIKIEPIFKAINALKKLETLKKSNLPTEQINSKAILQPVASGDSKIPKFKTILFTPRGKKFDQKMAWRLSKIDQLILICGRYEGVDERVAKHIADIEISIGDYVLMGGELPSMILIETIVRLIPGVIDNYELLKERMPAGCGRKGRGFIEYPQYTRPEIFSVKNNNKIINWRTPKVLISGDHKKIIEWRKKYGKVIGK